MYIRLVKITENRPLDDHRESAIWRFHLTVDDIITQKQNEIARGWMILTDRQMADSQ